jgi:hypothetical protein
MQLDERLQQRVQGCEISRGSRSTVDGLLPNQPTRRPIVEDMTATLPTQRPIFALLPATAAKTSSNVGAFRYHAR